MAPSDLLQTHLPECPECILLPLKSPGSLHLPFPELQVKGQTFISQQEYLTSRSFQASLLAKTFQKAGKGTDMWLFFFPLKKVLSTSHIGGKCIL